MDDVRPGYFKQLKSGGVLPVGPMESMETFREIFTQDHTMTGDLKINSSTWAKGHYQVVAQNVLFDVRDPSTLAAPAWPTLNEAAITSAALAEAQTNAWDYLTFAAEFGKTVDMVKTAQSRYRQHFNRVFNAAKRRGLKGGASASVDVFSEVWLEYRFGLRPLLYDIEAINEVLRRLKEGSPVLSRGWRSQTAESSRSGSSVLSGFKCQGFNSTLPGTPSWIGISGAATTHSWTRKRTVTGRAAVGVNVVSRDLTMADPLLTTWELLPWSVFVDYFINVGDLLAAYSPFASGTLAYATYTETLVDEVTQTSFWTATSQPGLVWHNPISPPSVVVTRTTNVKRKVVTPTPSLQVSINLDVSQVIDLLAVAWGFRRKGNSLIRSLATRR